MLSQAIYLQVCPTVIVCEATVMLVVQSLLVPISRRTEPPIQRDLTWE